MTRLRAFIRGSGGDAFIVALFVAAELEAWLTVEGWEWPVSLFAALSTLPLLLRRRSAFAAAFTISSAVAVESFLYEPATEANAPFIAFLLAYLALGLHEERVRALVGAVIGFALLLVLVSNGPDGLVASDVFVLSIFVFGPVAAGIGVRERTAHAAELRERARELEEARGRAAEIAATEERARIARELHDVIAHSIGAMTVQAGAARTLLRDDPARARESIEAVEETGREALAETRRLLGILRRDVAAPALAPQPGLAALDRLVDTARADGLTVELAVDGAPRQLPAGRDLAAYRIVQDGLARARGRDGVTRVHVRLRWRPDALEIEIDDDGRVGTGARGDGPVELAAMRERLALYDGTIEARRRSDGVSSVRARLPLEAAS